MKRASSLLVSTAILIACAGCTPTAAIQLSADLGAFHLDGEVDALERAVCAAPTSTSCATLSAIADVVFDMEHGPAASPRLPSVIPAVVDVPFSASRVDVARWYEESTSARMVEKVGPCAGDVSDVEAVEGCGFGRRRRLPLGELDFGGLDPALLAEARLVQAQVERIGGETLVFPSFEMALGAGEEAATVVARSGTFDGDGIAAVTVVGDGMTHFADAIAAGDGFITVERIPSSTPSLMPNNDGTLMRPTGEASLRLVLDLEVPLTAVAGGLTPGL